MPSSMDTPPEEFSRGKIKREMEALQALGKVLVELPDAQLQKVELPEQLREAILHARSLTSNEAKRRQLQYIGKLMRDIDPTAIQKSIQHIDKKHSQQTEQFHLVEQWRDELIAEGDPALHRFIEAYPTADRQMLRQWVRKAKQDKKNEKNTGGATGLFKYLRTILG